MENHGDPKIVTPDSEKKKLVGKVKINLILPVFLIDINDLRKQDCR